MVWFQEDCWYYSYSKKRSGQIPAFGDWDCTNDLPITQYFECARQAGLTRYSSSSGECDPSATAADLYAPPRKVRFPLFLCLCRRINYMFAFHFYDLYFDFLFCPLSGRKHFPVSWRNLDGSRFSDWLHSHFSEESVFIFPFSSSTFWAEILMSENWILV